VSRSSDMQHLQCSRGVKGATHPRLRLVGPQRDAAVLVQSKASSTAHATVEPGIASFVRRIWFMDLPHHWLAPF
jgi:hypothetical protein